MSFDIAILYVRFGAACVIFAGAVRQGAGLNTLAKLFLIVMIYRMVSFASGDQSSQRKKQPETEDCPSWNLQIHVKEVGIISL